MTGSGRPLPIDYTLPLASAQVKSAILLAALNTPGTTIVREPVVTRDHSERMLRRFGAHVEVSENGDDGRTVSLTGQAELSPQRIAVPGDISSAAFPLAAALIVPDSQVTLEHVGLNPSRTGMLDALALMGADIETREDADLGGDEPVGTLRIRQRALSAAEIPASLAPRMIDEYPALMVAAAFADGETEMRGLEELRVKESDRLAAMAKGLAACGVAVRLLEDGMTITGTGGEPVPGGATIDSRLDHRIAMAFAILGLHARRPVLIEDRRPIETSFPGFAALMTKLGASAG